MRRLLSYLLVVVVAAGLVLPASLAIAQPPQPAPGRPVLLALGDSVTAGEGSHPDRAEWGTYGFVPLLTTDLRADLDCLPAATPNARRFCPQLTAFNLGRPAEPTLGLPGVTAGAVIAEQLPTALSLLAERNGNANPRDDIEVVALSVGGNELYDTAGQYCLGPTGPGPDCFPQLAAVFQTYAGQLATILAQVRAAGGPDLRIAVMTYYNPLPYCGAGDPATLQALGHVVLEGSVQTGPGFNDVIRQVAAMYGAETAETYEQLGAGDFADCKHPNASGHVKVAEAFSDALLP
jgi:lysophospholipase L1-like esterase